MKTIKPVSLTPRDFKPYGHVISVAKRKPLAKSRELTYWSKISLLKIGKTVSTGVLFAHSRAAVVKKLEKHIRTPEVLVGLEGNSVVCFAKPSSTDNEIHGMKAFHVRQGDAVAMHAGTWHSAPFPVGGKGCKLLVLFAIDTEASDLEFRDLTEETRIVGV